MKTRNLFLSLCAFAAICSCSKEIEPGVKDSEVLAEDTFIKINIAAPSVASKGTDGGTEAGTAAEHAVKNVMLAFFASNGEFIETKEYSDFIALFNGSKSGASAPDHMHFQLVNKDYFPYAIETPMTGVIEKIVLRSSNAEELEAKVNAQLELLQREGELPASHTNLFCEYKNDEWVFTIFPRITHRPRQFFSEGEDRLMMSPGAIDMTGHLIAAREEDFEKITKEVIVDIFKQISKHE